MLWLGDPQWKTETFLRRQSSRCTSLNLLKIRIYSDRRQWLILWWLWWLDGVKHSSAISPGIIWWDRARAFRARFVPSYLLRHLYICSGVCCCIVSRITRLWNRRVWLIIQDASNISETYPKTHKSSTSESPPSPHSQVTTSVYSSIPAVQEFWRILNLQ